MKNEEEKGETGRKKKRGNDIREKGSRRRTLEIGGKSIKEREKIALEGVSQIEKT